MTACSPAVLDPAGPVGAGDRFILLDSLAIMSTIVVPTVIATLAFAWWFRSSNGKAKRLPQWAFSGQLELVFWAVPVLTIMFLGGLTWIGSHQLDPYRPLPSRAKPLEVQVVSLDWKWLFIYPDEGVASVNALVVPVGTPVHFSLTSASVLNTFFVPRLGGMIYTMNGMQTQLSLQADKPGLYRGLSGDFSGDGFAGMHFDVKAVPRPGFDAWVAATRSRGPALDPTSYAALAKQSSNLAPFAYATVSPGLFQAVVTQAIAQGPGPDPAQPSARVSPKPPGAR